MLFFLLISKNIELRNRLCKPCLLERYGSIFFINNSIFILFSLSISCLIFSNLSSILTLSDNVVFSGIILFFIFLFFTSLSKHFTYKLLKYFFKIINSFFFLIFKLLFNLSFFILLFKNPISFGVAICITFFLINLFAPLIICNNPLIFCMLSDLILSTFIFIFSSSIFFTSLILSFLYFNSFKSL